MSERARWESPEIVERGGRWRPDFAEDPRFNAYQWRDMTDDLTPAQNEWRSYRRDDDEVARLLLVLNFSSHTGDRAASAILISNVEVREDLQHINYIGTDLIDALAAEYRDSEIYLGPTRTSKPFWKRFGWPMCDCEACGCRDLIVRRPA